MTSMTMSACLRIGPAFAKPDTCAFTLRNFAIRPVGGIFVNMTRPPLLDKQELELARDGELPLDAITESLRRAGLARHASQIVPALAREAADHALRVALEQSRFVNIVPDLKAGKVVMIAAHGNSLRSLVKYLDDIDDDTIVGLNIPTGIPLVYKLDENFKPIVKGGEYLDPEAAAAGAAAVSAQGKK
jgi:hypothetical protein